MNYQGDSTTQKPKISAVAKFWTESRYAPCGYAVFVMLRLFKKLWVLLFWWMGIKWRRREFRCIQIDELLSPWYEKAKGEERRQRKGAVWLLNSCDRNEVLRDAIDFLTNCMEINLSSRSACYLNAFGSWMPHCSYSFVQWTLRLLFY